MNDDFEYLMESVEYFDDYEYIDESFSNPKSAFMGARKLFNEAVANNAKIEREAMRLEKKGEYKEAIKMYKQAIADANKFIKDAEKLPDANIHDAIGFVPPLVGELAVHIAMNKGKIKDASKNYDIKCFRNWIKTYNSKINELKSKK